MSHYLFRTKVATLSSSAGYGSSGCLNSNFRPMKLAVLIIPHDSAEDTESATENYALQIIGEKEQGMDNENICLQDQDEMLLPKAINYLNQRHTKCV